MQIFEEPILDGEKIIFKVLGTNLLASFLWPCEISYEKFKELNNFESWSSLHTFPNYESDFTSCDESGFGMRIYRAKSLEGKFVFLLSCESFNEYGDFTGEVHDFENYGIVTSSFICVPNNQWNVYSVFKEMLLPFSNKVVSCDVVHDDYDFEACFQKERIEKLRKKEKVHGTGICGFSKK